MNFSQIFWNFMWDFP